MCRLLYVRGSVPFDPQPHLQQFAALCKASKEYQGHGWGVSTYSRAGCDAGEWRHLHSIVPIWEDELPAIRSVDVAIAHARSAFNDEGIVVENNMPFVNGESVFIFNGELRGVRLKQLGRIGAEKIFNTILECNTTNDIGEALTRAVRVIRSRTRYIRAMNIIIAVRDKAYIYSQAAEDPDYFTMQVSCDKPLVICSDRYRDPSCPEFERSWNPIVYEKVEVI